MGYSRDEAEEIAQPMSGVYGLKMDHPVGREVNRRMIEYSKREGAFFGPWRNHQNIASHDPRCLGHRHDQTILGFIIHEMNLEMHIPHESFLVYSYDSTDMDRLADSICLLCRGM